MHQHQKGRLLALLSIGMLLVGGCASPPPVSGEATEPAPVTARAPEPTQPAPSATVERTAPPETLDSPTSVPPQTEELPETPASEAPTTPAGELPSTPASTDGPAPGQMPGPEGTETADPDVPDLFSTDPCADPASESCLEPLDEAALGATPPESEVTTNAYSYTVKEYVEWIVGDLNSTWSQWFVENDFARPEVYYRIILDTEPALASNCVDPQGLPLVVAHDYPNAFYCGNDPYVMDPKISDNGMMILPVTTLQRMWTGDVLGKQSKQAGDFAAAIIIAHEFGHHVEDELSLQWEQYYPGQVPTFTGSNQEALADCFAGVWMTTAYYDGVLEPGDAEEAVAALDAIGAPQPGSTHPSAAERYDALMLGYLGASGYGGDPMECVDRYWN